MHRPREPHSPTVNLPKIPSLARHEQQSRGQPVKQLAGHVDICRCSVPATIFRPHHIPHMRRAARAARLSLFQGTWRATAGAAHKFFTSPMTRSWITWSPRAEWRGPITWRAANRSSLLMRVAKGPCG